MTEVQANKPTSLLDEEEQLMTITKQKERCRINEKLSLTWCFQNHNLSFTPLFLSISGGSPFSYLFFFSFIFSHLYRWSLPMSLYKKRKLWRYFNNFFNNCLNCKRKLLKSFSTPIPPSKIVKLFVTRG